jgi:hypothetical protein
VTPVQKKSPLEKGLSAVQLGELSRHRLFFGFHRKAGASVAMGALYEPYRAWCDQQGFRAVSAPQFRELFAALCDLSGFPRVVEDGKPYCLNLALAA